MIDLSNRTNGDPISRVYQMDCSLFMKEVPDKFFELAIVDPEYGIGASEMTMGSGKHKFIKNKRWDNSIPTEKYFNELFRVSQNQIIWGGNYFSQYLPPSPHWIIWDKKNPNLSFAEGEQAWIRKGKNLRMFYHYSAQVENGGKIHPTQKPIRLYYYCLNNYAKPGDKILDTHLGSQSSRIAAYHLGFDFWGTEIDGDYFKDGCQRFERECHQVYTLTNGSTIKQQSLF